MKKSFLMVACAAALLSSCSQNDVLAPDDSADNAITFNTYVGSRASVMNQVLLQTDGFVVSAYHTGTDAWVNRTTQNPFMTNTSVSWSNGAWTYSPLKYWPNEQNTVGDFGKVSFFAYSPSNVNITYNDATKDAEVSKNANPTLTYACPADESDQVDLVADMQSDKCKTDKSTVAAVKFSFNHILSKIGFKAQLNEDYNEYTSVTVTSVKVYYNENGVQNKATYTYTTNGAIGTWSFPETEEYMTKNSVACENVIAETVLGYESSKKVETATDKYLMLLPQTTSEGALYVDVTYTVTTVKDGKDQSVVTNTVRVSNLPATTWEAGKQYTYTLKIGLNAVVFDPSIDVEDWVNGSQPNDTGI